MKRWRWLLLVSMASFFAAMACATITTFNPFARTTATPSPAPADEAVARHLEVLEAIDTAVREQYIRADLDGVDWDAVMQKYRAQVEAGLSEDEFADAMRALVAELPAGNAFFQTRAERIALETADTNTYQGIGVFYGFREAPEPHVVVLSVIKGSPAEQAGLQAHDAIYGIDGQPIQASERATIADRIRGSAGSSVTLNVQSPGQPRRDVTVQRGTISASDAPRGGVLGNSGIAYYRAPVVAGTDLAQTIAQDLGTQGQSTPLTGIILDLRVAGSSSGWPLADMLSLFGDGTLGEFYTRTLTETLSITGTDVAGSQHAALVILVGPDTRGTAEIFAGILQGTRLATLIGLPTIGETEGFQEIALPDGSRLTLAASSFRLPDGTDFSKTCLTPDVRVDGDWDSFASSDTDPGLEAALNQLQK